MTEDNKNDIGKIIKQQRVMVPMTLTELSSATGVSASHLGRIERGERFPSAHVLRKLAKPLGFAEDELFTLAGFLSPQSSGEVNRPTRGQLDPRVVALLSQEPVEIQRTVIAILTILKSIDRANGHNISFAEYVHRKYPQVDEDSITMIQDILEHPPKD